MARDGDLLKGGKAAGIASKDERGWSVEQPEEGVYVAKSTSPYPVKFEYGIVYGMVRRFAPDDTVWIVEIAEQNDEYGAYRITVS